MRMLFSSNLEISNKAMFGVARSGAVWQINVMYGKVRKSKVDTNGSNPKISKNKERSCLVRCGVIVLGMVSYCVVR